MDEHWRLYIDQMYSNEHSKLLYISRSAHYMNINYEHQAQLNLNSPKPLLCKRLNFQFGEAIGG